MTANGATDSKPASVRGRFWSALDEIDSDDDENENGVVVDDDELDADSDGNAPVDGAQPLDEEETRLRRKRNKLKALLNASKKRADILTSEVDSQVETVMSQQRERTQMLEMMSRRGQELQQEQEQRSEELLQEIDTLHAKTSECKESESRVNYLATRIHELLRNKVQLEHSQIEALDTLRKKEKQMLEQLDDIMEQYEKVRNQNAELTCRLLEESSLSRRLSDQLAEAEERFLRCGVSGDLQQLPDSADQLAESEERLLRLGVNGVPALPLSRRQDPAGLEGSMSRSRGAEDVHGALPEQEQSATLAPLPEVAGGSSPGSSSSTTEVQAVEALLMEALDRVAFGHKVVRWEPGLYGFGNVRAAVRLDHQGQLVAAVQGDAGNYQGFQPMQDFLEEVATLEAAAQEELQAIAAGEAVGSIEEEASQDD